MTLAMAVENEDETVRERRCIVSGEVLPDRALIRFVVSPDGQVTPDVAAKLPGRGIWVGATQEALATAIRKNLFAKAAKRKRDRLAACWIRRLSSAS